MWVTKHTVPATIPEICKNGTSSTMLRIVIKVKCVIPVYTRSSRTYGDFGCSKKHFRNCGIYCSEQQMMSDKTKQQVSKQKVCSGRVCLCGSCVFTPVMKRNHNILRDGFSLRWCCEGENIMLHHGMASKSYRKDYKMWSQYFTGSITFSTAPKF